MISSLNPAIPSKALLGTTLRSMLHALCVLLLGSALIGCGPQWQQIATQLEDRDGDGWFSAGTNAAMTLTLTSASFPAVGSYEVLVDEVKFPISPTLNGRFSVPIGTAGTVMPIGVPVATRVQGVTGFGTSGTPFGINVRVVYRPPPFGDPGIIVGDTRVAFGETAGALPPATVAFSLGTVTLNFSVTTVAFPDPNPDDPAGDSDGDGIPESNEARLSGAFGGIFDPRPGSARDLDLIIGHTDPAFALSQWAREDLRSRFIQNGFNLHLDEGTLNNVTGAGGQMNLTGTGATATGTVTESQSLAVRNANVGPVRRATAYFVLLAGSAAVTNPNGSTSNVFGVSIPGAMVMRTGFIGINDIAWYQAGVLMHELGHELGLCHPVFQDGVTIGGERWKCL